MSMDAELTLLPALIIIFLLSFCGLLQKIRKTYEQDRVQAERTLANNNRHSDVSLTQVYVSPVFLMDENDNDTNRGVFPSEPPPYTEYYCGPPPKYEDIFKTHEPVSLAPVHTTV